MQGFASDQGRQRCFRFVFLFAQKLLVKTECRFFGVAHFVGGVKTLQRCIGRLHILDFRCCEKFHFGAQTAADDRVIGIKAEAHRLAKIDFFLDIIADDAVELLGAGRTAPCLFPLRREARDLCLINRDAPVKTVFTAELTHHKE